VNILIVEDEQHSREELEYQLAQLEPNAKIETAENAQNAWDRLESSDAETPFDVIFLDIQMPGMNGLELAARISRLQQPPRIVFATANPQHAITAFDLEGIDYLLKPYRTARLVQTLERVRKLMLEPKANTNQSIQLEKIWAARGEVGVLLNPNDILYCQADGDTVIARTTERCRYDSACKTSRPDFRKDRSLGCTKVFWSTSSTCAKSNRSFRGVTGCC
jgi:DNA-binding LytR/AlgR family response regulator